jgi:hypothetical protein
VVNTETKNPSMTNQNKIEIYKELQKELEDRKKKQVFFTNDFINIEYDLAHDWLYADWIGYQTEATIKEGCTKMMEALIKFHLIKVLNDNTHVLGIWTPAVQWLGTVWFPQMEAAGLKQLAWIYSPSALSQFSTNETLKEISTSQIIQTFYNVDDAKKWLSETE